VPAAIADYLARENLPARLRLSTETDITGLPWPTRPLLEITQGATDGSDEVSVTGGYAAIAETGTLMLASGAGRPTTLNFLPETHIVVLSADRVVGALEQAWAKLRREFGAGTMPRTVNFITGPSRSADIEQTLQMGAHGPRRLHIIMIDGETAAGS
jgi:L-lactate dehydrogenase complex protein LldG